MFICTLLLICFIVTLVEGVVFGLDLSQPIARSHADCFKQQDVQYVIARGWKCSGSADSAAVTTHKHIRDAGIPHFGVYL
jgi:hypothetical protein